MDRRLLALDDPRGRSCCRWPGRRSRRSRCSRSCVTWNDLHLAADRDQQRRRTYTLPAGPRHLPGPRTARNWSAVMAGNVLVTLPVLLAFLLAQRTFIRSLDLDGGEGMSAARSRCERVTKVYDGGVVAVDDVSLEVRPGEFVVLVGPVGLRQVDAAADDRRAGEGDGGDGPDRRARRDRRSRRRTATSRWCSRTTRCTRTRRCARTSRSGCGSARTPRAEIDGGWARWRRCSGSRSCWTAGRRQLSGGQRQRVAMGRALVREPRRSCSTSRSRTSTRSCAPTMRAELARLHERLGVTTVYVTHDQVEAMTLGERVAVLRDGVLQQFDVPQELFRAAGEPVRRRVHRLAGDEPRRAPTSTASAWRSPGTRCRCRPGSRARQRRRPARPAPGRVRARGPWTDPELSRMEVEAEVVEALGDEALVSFRVDAPAVEVEEVAHRRRAACSPTTPARASSRACAGASTCAPASASSSRSTTASCTCSTRERARAARGGDGNGAAEARLQPRAGRPPAPARWPPPRRVARSSAAAQCAAAVELGEEAAERRVAAADRVARRALGGAARRTLAVGRSTAPSRPRRG